MIRLDVGAGLSRSEGWLRLDYLPQVEPDLLCDLRTEKIPLPDDSVEAVRCWHCLEHIWDVEPVFAELWRVCSDGASLDIRVPHYLSRCQWDTTGHVRAFTPGVFVNLDLSNVTINTELPHFYRLQCDSLELTFDAALVRAWPEMPWVADGVRDALAEYPSPELVPQAVRLSMGEFVPGLFREIHAVLRAVKP